MSETYHCYLRILSPVHVGCDQVYEPTGFSVDEKAGALIAFDPLDFAAGLNDDERNRFNDLCRKGTIASLLEIYQFLQGCRCTGNTVEVSIPFVEHYRETLALSLSNEGKIKQELNRFTIARTAFNPNNGGPYIPGSSIKGSIRTACLNLRSQSLNLRSRGEDGKLMETRILYPSPEQATFDTDPFRMLKVSDFMPVGRVRTGILYAVNRKKKISANEARGPYQILEIVKAGALFEGWITLGTPPGEACIRRPLTIEEVLEATDFYVSELKRENDELLAIGACPMHEQIQDSSMLLRIGRHSGAECVTVEGHRKIRIMQKQGVPPLVRPGATTLWLASPSARPNGSKGLQPFGWVEVGKMTRDIQEKLRHEKGSIPCRQKP